METLVDKSWIEKHYGTLPLWQQNAFESFSSMIMKNENPYPCIPARQGFITNNLRFGFVGDPRESSSIKNLSETLKNYGACSRDTGNYASLVIFFETPDNLIAEYQVEDYRQLFWCILNNLTQLDEKEWPADIPTNPTHHQWEFCFDGEPYFTFCATPAHENRKSRHFPCLLLAFQPRWVFKELNDSTAFGRQIKKSIRERLNNYDSIPAHPDLKWYGGEDNYEWKQYFLSDDDVGPTKCPFTRMKATFSSFLPSRFNKK